MISRLQSPRSRRCVKKVFQREVLLGGGMLLLLPTALSANPTGGAVAAGSATIAGQGTSAVVVKQTSNTAIINWQSFSINSGESTSFLQPGANSAALNRVLGGQTSIINGTLSANGQVYIVNGNGVIVGPGGVVNANAFTASTRDITNADFLSGNLHFTGSNDAGVQNLGSITALGGNVALIGRTVDNEGTITAPKGTAGLISANDVLLAQNNADGSTITVSPSTVAPVTSAKVGVKNGGAITAAAAELKAANGNIYGLAVQNLGTIRATTVTHQGGHIWLTSDSGKVSNAGTLDASATAAAGKGGTVVVKSVSGAVSHTGQIIAQGGQGGVGGNAEISGAQLEFSGTVDLTAFKGKMGNLLLDPTDVQIVTGGGTDITASTVDPSAIVLALNSSDVTISATNSISVDDAIDSSGNSNTGNLALDAPSLTFSAPVTLNGTLSGTGASILVLPGGVVQNGIDAAGASANIGLGLDDTFTLSTQLLINKSLTIEGNGATLNGQGSTRIMEIDGGTVVIDDTVFTGGNGAGSTGASGAGNSGFGGAVMVYGQNTSANVTFTNDSFINNSASSGGAIFNTSISGGGNSVLIENSTITGNSATLGTAIYAQASFGGSATFGLKSDTIAENSGTAAIYTAVVSSGNASISINNTILAGNTASGTESDYQNGGGGTLIDGDYNLYGQNGDAGGFTPGGSHDILLFDSISNELGPLGVYGNGFNTPTLPLLQTSESLESGDPAFNETLSQNGFLRGDAASFTGSNSDIGAYEAQFVEVQADPIITLYGVAPVLTYTITSGPAAALLTGAPALVTPATNAGTYGEDIGQGTLTTSPDYVIDFTNGDLTITQRPVTVIIDPGQGKTYGTADPTLTYTTNPADAVSGLVNGDTLTGSPSYAGSTGVTTPAGIYQTTLGTVADSTGNYIVTVSSPLPAFIVSPRPVGVNLDAGQSKTYGSADPTLTYNTDPADTTSGLVNGDTLSGSPSYLGAGVAANVGNYPIAPGTLANPNYFIMPGSAGTTFAITPRAVSVLPDAGQGKVYGAPDPALTYTTTGLVNGDTLTGSPSYAGSTGATTPAGTYATTLGTLADPTGDYVVTLSSAAPTFSVTPATLFYAADQVQVPSGTMEFPAFTGTVVGFVNGDTQTTATTGSLFFTTTANSTSPDGYYEIDGSGLSASNYVFAQAATNVAALIIGNPMRGTLPPNNVPTNPAQTQTAASTPNTQVSQAIAQSSSTSSSANPDTAPVPGGTTTTPVQNAAPPTVDINVSSISPNESIVSTPVSSGGADSQSASSIITTSVASGSSFSPDIGAQKVTPGQSVTIGGSPGVPPPPVVQAQLNQILGTGSLDTLSTALSDVTTAAASTSTPASTGDAGSSSAPPSAASSTSPADSSPTTSSTATTDSSSSTSNTPGPNGGQSASAAAVAVAASQPNAYANGPIVRGPSAMIAPGQTVTLGGGHASASPPPPMVQAQFNQGFSSDSRDSLAKAAGL